MMPELDGFGVLTALRDQKLAADLPMIVISAMSEIDAVVRCIELGAEDFLFKPFNPTLLRARVIATLEKKALRDQTREELRRKQMELNEARTLQLAARPALLRRHARRHAGLDRGGAGARQGGRRRPGRPFPGRRHCWCCCSATCRTRAPARR